MDISLVELILTFANYSVASFLRSRDYYKLILVNRDFRAALLDSVDLSDIDEQPHDNRA
jgi:hypothetical protein